MENIPIELNNTFIAMILNALIEADKIYPIMNKANIKLTGNTLDKKTFIYGYLCRELVISERLNIIPSLVTQFIDANIPTKQE